MPKQLGLYKRAVEALFLVLLTSSLESKPLNLGEILEWVKLNHPQLQALKQQTHYSHAMAILKTTTNPMTLNASTASASEDSGESGQEFTLSLQKKILFGTTNSATKAYLSSDKEALALKERQAQIELSNHISYLYHDACLDQQQLDDYKKVVSAFKLLYEKRKKAYNFGELSKKDLLLLAIELKLITQKELKLQSQAKQSLAHLDKEAYLLNNEKLFCQDLKAITPFKAISLDNSLEFKALKQSLKASQSLYKRYEEGMTPIGVSAGFDQELDMQRISFGVSIPLNFSSDKQKAKRVAALSQKNMLSSHLNVLKNSQNRENDIFKEELNLAFGTIENSLEVLKLYHEELIPLIEKGYHLGETSLIEYLLAKREMWKLEQSLSQQKKSYYQSLFTFYNLVSSKE